MNPTPHSILDACALIAYLNDELGADIVSKPVEKIARYTGLTFEEVENLDV
jgi:PIN domain nuclease of toxin-antitoxin system